MKKIIALTALCFILATPKGNSQQASYLSMQYAISFGTGDLGEYISKPSFRGALTEFRIAVTDNILIGGDVAWNVFYENKPYDTYTLGTESLSGVQFRYQNAVPIMASIDYFITTANPLKPYVGLGIGTMYSERSTEMGLYYLEENPWHFALKPELGLLYEINYTASVKLCAKYYNGFSAGSLENQGYISICAGLAFSL